MLASHLQINLTMEAVASEGSVKTDRTDFGGTIK